MAGRVDARLAELGIKLPDPTPAWANYLSHVASGYQGKLAAELSVEDGYRAARICAINLLSHLKVACGGDLDRVVRCIEVGGFVNSAPQFYDQPKVLNGASDLLFQVFGESGRHTRFAVGVAAIPFNLAVEVKAIFQLS